MVFKVFFFLAVAVSQVAAGTLMQRSVVEFLSTRQTPSVCTSVCQIFQDGIRACTTTTCICSVAMVTSLQACITCAVTSDPSASDAAQRLINTYKESCPTATLTIPPTVSGTSAGTTPTTPIASPSTLIAPSTVSSITTQAPITQVTVGTSSTEAPTTTDAGNIPGLTTNTGSKAADVKRAGVVAVGAMIGAALMF